MIEVDYLMKYKFALIKIIIILYSFWFKLHANIEK